MTDLTNKNFNDFISSEQETVVVEFWANWSRVCRQLTRSLSVLPNGLSDRVGRVLIEDEENTFSICEKYNITSIPTLIYFKNGVEIERSIGFQGSPPIIQRLKK